VRASHGTVTKIIADPVLSPSPFLSLRLSPPFLSPLSLSPPSLLPVPPSLPHVEGRRVGRRGIAEKGNDGGKRRRGET